jgi:hypothetical protein
MSESSHCFRKGNRNSGRRLCIMVCPSFWEDYCMLIYTHCWELMNSVGSHGSLSLPFVMKVMVCHFVSDSHEVMTALIVVLPLTVVVEISLQLHQSFPNWCCTLECRSMGTTVRRLVQRLSVQWEMMRKQKLRLLRYLGLRQHATQFAVSWLVDIKDWIFLHPTMVVVAIHLRCITNGW